MHRSTLLAGFLGLATSVVLAVSLAAAPHNGDVRFDGGIGVIPVIGVSAGPPAAAVLNVVRGVNPGGIPWRIEKLKANWNHDGNVHIDGKGLVLAGGNSAGTRGGISAVMASFFCGAGVTTPMLTTGAIPLDLAGNFKFDGEGFAIPPDPCDSPVLLIRTTSGAWLAAGIADIDPD